MMITNMAMMIMTSIKGIGTDIIEVDRIKKSMLEFKQKFLERIFTENEIAYCNQNKEPERHFAGRFAAKEAIAKAFGSGIGKDIAWKEMEILKDPYGKPSVKLSDELNKKYDHPKVLISISHCKKYANAVAIWS